MKDIIEGEFIELLISLRSQGYNDIADDVQILLRKYVKEKGFK